MKTLFSLTVIALVLMGCPASKHQLSTASQNGFEGKIAYNLPAPAQLSKKEINRYKYSIQSLLDTTLLNRSFSGEIVFAKEGQVLYKYTSGYADAGKQKKISESSSLHIASASKTFTGMAILQLVQENKLSLDDTVSKFFPGFPFAGVTVQTLLNHRSGLPNYVHFLENNGWDKSKKVTNENVLQALYSLPLQPEFSPDKHFSYSNTNFVLLALIIEKITCMSFPEYMNKKIFAPLQMTNTFVYQSKDEAKASPSFKYSGGLWQKDFLDDTYGDKNIYTTAPDLLIWSTAVQSGAIVKEDLLKKAFTPYSNEKRSVHNYGLAWRMLLLKNGKKVIYHNGRWHGTNCAFAYLPDEKVTIIIIGNKFSNAIYTTARKSYDIFGNYLQTGKESDDDEPVVNKKEIKTTSIAAAAKNEESHEGGN